MNPLSIQNLTEPKIQFLISSLKKRQWIFKESDPIAILTLMQKYGYSEMVSRFIHQRCPEIVPPELFLTPKLKDFLPSPATLKDMDRAVDRLLSALHNKEHIMIFGDYDVDGAASTSLLIMYLRHFTKNIGFYIPDRTTEGYGPSVQAFRDLREKGTSLVITVDCGTTALDALTYARENAMDVVIIDHHIPEAVLPPHTAIVNPNQKNDTSGQGHLCAAGVTFLVLVALQSRLKKQGIACPDLGQFLDMVALATICDVVPIKGINRAFVKQGLSILDRHTNPGLKVLSQICDLSPPYTPYHLGFIFGPHINAGGRVGASTLGTQLLTARSEEEALPLAKKLSDLNAKRKAIEAEALVKSIIKAEHQHSSPILCIDMEECHPGVIGIIAGRLKERFHKPVFVISFDEKNIGKGSGRSVPGVHLGSLVHQAKKAGLLMNGGGHAMAAGITIQREKFLDLKNFLTIKAHTLDPSDPKIHIDSSVHLSGANLDLVKELDQFGPFGAENPEPLFMIPHCSITKSQVRGGKHISCFLRSESGHFLEAIAFNSIDTSLERPLLENNSINSYHVVGALKIDRWQGREKVKLHIEDLMLITEGSSIDH